jgi:outer membrane protein assembly factor BamB
MARAMFQKRLVRELATALIVASVASGVFYAGPVAAQDNGNVLIADQFNNRVVEVDRTTHQVVWHFGNGSDIPGPHSVVGVNDAERFGPLTLISGTGTPPGLPGCSNTVNGCPDNRVFIVDPLGNIIWQYGQAGVTGAGPNQLNTPVQSLFLISFPQHLGSHVLITDQGNQRIILVSMSHQIEWQYGTTGVSGNGPNQLNSPNSAEVLQNGHILIADESNNRVIEIKPNGQLVKQFTAGGTISGAAFASRLPNGDTLISDSNNNRIVEVNGNDQVVWQYYTNTQPGSNPSPQPTRAVRLENGDTLISDQFNDRVFEINKAGKIVFQQGALNAPGDGFNELNGPYDAKQIGDFTGLTPPFGL